MQDSIDLDHLRESPHEFWYLASPYSRYERGLVEAFSKACQAAGWLIKHGVNVHSPIAHTHPVAMHANIDPCDHDIWLRADAPFMRLSRGLIVLMLDGWNDSYGVSVEIEDFQRQGKEIHFMEWPRK